MSKKFFITFLLLFLALAPFVSAHQPRIVYIQNDQDVKVLEPDLSQAFYDELKGSPRDYFINSESNFVLYLNLLVPEGANFNGRYSAKVFLIKENGSQEQVAELLADSVEWQEFYEEFGRDYYLKGPELEKTVPAGEYKIEVFSADNTGKYVLVVGKREYYNLNALLNVFWQIPFLKLTFFNTSVLEFFLTPFGIAFVAFVGALLIMWAVIYLIIGIIKEAIKHSQAKTLLLTSGGMNMKEEIISLLQRPIYNTSVAFISTASKTEEDIEYLKRDWITMKEELGFNVEEVDIDGKSESEVMKLLQLKDIIFVEGGNTFYLLKAMRKCNFEKIIRKLLKQGKVYIGVSAGSIVAGKTIKTAEWKHEINKFGISDFKGLNLVPFDIFVHYKPEHAEIIKKKIPWKWQRKKLKILTDEQAILVQGKEISLIGRGEQVII